ncbi:MAG: ABC transporter permease [Dehalococcoidia bacterium]|nr:ABC transporter permease [Dehalococcoidia bacterium]
MLPYLIRRLLATIPVLIVVGLFTFFLLRLTPGDPAAVIAGNESTHEEYLQIRERLGLDDPIYIQLGKWSVRILQGDFGTSIRSGKPVFDLIKTRIGPSVSLTIATEIIAVLVAIPLGVLAAWKANSLIDRAVMVFAAIGFSIPIFWLGFILIWVFGLWAFGLDNPILPVAGYARIDDGLLDYLRHLALPALSLGLVVIALVARMTRASVLEVLKEDYVRTARAKGLTEKTVLIRHALRSASLPILTIIGLGLAGLLSGAVVTESVFAIPGLGRLAVDAIATRDYPIIQALIILIGTFYVFINLAVDIAYAVLDPRIRY